MIKTLKNFSGKKLGGTILIGVIVIAFGFGGFGGGFSSNNQNNINLVDTNEAQFRILANKFNEAVEVILELSDKVKKLEHTIYKNHNETKKSNGIFYYINVKILFSMIFIPLLILGIFTLPFDFYTFKLVFSDIILSM